MDPEPYLSHLRADGAALLVAARRAPTSAVPTCPAWDLAKLVRHMGGGHRWVSEMVRTRATEMLAFPAAPDAWEDVPPWYEAGLSDLVATLEAAGPGASAWQFEAMGPGPVRFWFRRMAHETSVHRWDAELAVGTARSIDPVLAADGIDEALTMLGVRLTALPEPTLGGSLALVATDIDFSCTVELAPDHVERRAGLAGADATVRAGASSLRLWLAGRRLGEAAEVAVEGDGAVAAALGQIPFG